MSFEALIACVRGEIAKLVGENVELRRKVKELALQNGELCDKVHALREERNIREEAES